MRGNSNSRPSRTPAGVAVLVALAIGWLLPVVAMAQTRPGQAVSVPSRLVAMREAAEALYREKRPEDALSAYENLLVETRLELGRDHETVALAAFSVGVIADELGQFEKAVEAYREHVRIGDQIYGKDSFLGTTGMQRLADALVKTGRLSEAEPILRKVLAIHGGVLGANHSFSASTHAGLGAVDLARGDGAAALTSYRQAVRLLTERKESQTLARLVQNNEIRRVGGAFTGLVEAAWLAARGNAVDARALSDETFAASQLAWTTAAGAALARMSARIGVGESELGKRIRRQQEAVERVLALNKEDTKALAAWSEVQRRDPIYSEVNERFRQMSTARFRDNAPHAKRQEELIGRLVALLKRCPLGQAKSGCGGAVKERDAIQAELGQIAKASAGSTQAMAALGQERSAADARLPGYREFSDKREARVLEMSRLDQLAAAERKAILKSFPDYVALTDPKPLTLEATGGLLGPDEALVTLLVGQTHSYIWAVTRERSQWARIEAGRKSLAEHVAALRAGLDPLTAVNGQDGRPVGFDFERAHALYRLVLGPVEGVIRSKRHLILVPTGPLTSLPFQALLTGVAAAGTDARDTLRRAPWLARRHATSVLPSVPSLAALRRVRLSLKAAEPFLGVGDPALSGPPAASHNGRARAGGVAVAAVYRNGVADLRALRELQPLPETAAELKAIAKALRAPKSSLLLGVEATETRVRRLELDRFQVVHFATHGLVAGELSGVNEPALVLTPPIRPSEADDGLLTASEVAALRLKADWVVLSACNTAAGSEVGAEALSGLARAFFFAGARALLVSHWAVNSDATVWLTTQTFSRLAKSPNLGRAEAFRQTMMAMVDAGLPPSHWAPFVIVGEGGSAR